MVVDSATADHGLTDDSSATGGWKTIATPNASINLLSLQNGVSATIGQADLPPGTYSGFRFIIDPTKSSVTLKGGRVLSGSSSPNITFPSASRSGIKIVLAQPVTITSGTTTVLLIDFNVNDSFVMRGNSIDKNGLLFKPVIKASVTNLALTNATVRLANATDTPLDLLQSGAALSGSSSLAFTAGHSFSFVAYPTTTGAVQFVTLSNVYTPTTGLTGLRVFNATTGTTSYDVFVTTSGSSLGTAAVANVAPGGSGSAFVSVPAGAEEVRVTMAGNTTVLVDLTAQTLTAGQNYTLVIAPPMLGSTTLRAFLVAGC